MQISRAGLALHLNEHHGDALPGSTVFVWMTGIDEFHREITATNYKYQRPGIETTFNEGKSVEVIDSYGNRIRFNENFKPEKSMQSSRHNLEVSDRWQEVPSGQASRNAPKSQ